MNKKVFTEHRGYRIAIILMDSLLPSYYTFDFIIHN